MNTTKIIDILEMSVIVLRGSVYSMVEVYESGSTHPDILRA